MIELLKLYPGCLVIADNDGKILWANDAFEELTGYSILEVRGLKPKDFLHGPDTDPETIEYMSSKRKQGLPFEAEILNYRKDGSGYWIYLKAVPIYIDGELKFWVANKYPLATKEAFAEQLDKIAKLVEKLS